MQSPIQQTLIQRFSYSALCLRGNRVQRICISSNCKGNNIYLCGKSQQKCQCHFQHRNCPTINFETFCNKFLNYKNLLNSQVNEYIQRFEKVYTNLYKKITKQLNLFKSNYQSLLFGQIKSSIQNKIQNKKYNSISSYQISQYLNSIQLFSQQINCGKLSVNEARQIDRKMIDFFQFLENLYKQKIHKKHKSGINYSKAKSLSTNCLQRSNSTIETYSHLRKSSILQRGELNSDYNFECSNLSVMLQKKKPLNIEEIKFNQNLLLRPPKINLSYPKNIPSKIINSCSLINHFIGKKIKSYQLKYRASQNNFSIQNFYDKLNVNSVKCKELKGKHLGSLFLFKTQFNHVIGAFTQVSFLLNLSTMEQKVKQNASDSQDQNELNPQKIKNKKNFLNDIRSSTFLFSLDLKEKYALKNPQKAIYLGSKSFGFGELDLKIKHKSNIVRNNYCKIGDTFKLQNQVKNINIDYDSKNLKIIGSRYGKKFKIFEWEYFSVIFDHKQ